MKVIDVVVVRKLITGQKSQVHTREAPVAQMGRVRNLGLESSCFWAQMKEKAQKKIMNLCCLAQVRQDSILASCFDLQERWGGVLTLKQASLMLVLLQATV